MKILHFYSTSPYRTVLTFTLLLSGCVSALWAQSSYTTISAGTEVSFSNGNLYVENLHVKKNAVINFEDGTSNEIVLDGQTSTFEASEWNYGTATQNFIFRGVPDPTKQANVVTIDNIGQIKFSNIFFEPSPSSSFKNFVLKDISEYQRIDVLALLKHKHILFLGDVPNNAPTLADTANKMTLAISIAGNINDEHYTRDVAIVTPGRSRLGRYILNNEQEVIFPVATEDISPLGNPLVGFAPVAIRNTRAGNDATFYVTASKFLYDWDSTFRSDEDKANPIHEMRQDNVKKHWIITSSSDLPQNVVIKFQHQRNHEIEQENYDYLDRTIISRYIGTKGTNGFTLNRKNSAENEFSTPSFSYWENMQQPRAPWTENGNLANVIAGNNNDVTHIAYVTDFSNRYPIYMKAGFAEDSMPVGPKMVVPSWEGSPRGFYLINGNVVLKYPASKQYRIKEYKILYTTDRQVAEESFQPGSQHDSYDGIPLYRPQPTFDVALGGNNTTTKSDSIYFRLIPVPDGPIPFDNPTVSYIPSPVGVIAPNREIDGDISLVNNPISITGSTNIEAFISNKLNIASGTGYLVDPVSKVTIYHGQIERFDSNWGLKIPLSSISIAPGIYVILIQAKMEDGSQKNLTTKVVVQ